MRSAMQLTAASSRVPPVSSTPVRLPTTAGSSPALCALFGTFQGITKPCYAWTARRSWLLAASSSSSTRAFTSHAAGDAAPTDAAAPQPVAHSCSSWQPGVAGSRQQVRPPTVLRRPRLPLAAATPGTHGVHSSHEASAPLGSVHRSSSRKQQQPQPQQGEDCGGGPCTTPKGASSSTSNSRTRCVGGPRQRSRLPPHIRQQAAAAARRQHLLQLQLPAVQLVFPAPPGLDLGVCTSSDTNQEVTATSCSSRTVRTDTSGVPGWASASGAGGGWRAPIVAAFTLMGRPIPEGMQQRQLHTAGDTDPEEYAASAADVATGSSHGRQHSQYVYTPDPQHEWDTAAATGAAVPGAQAAVQDLQQQLVRPAPVAAPVMPLHDLWPLLQLDPEAPEQLADIPRDLAAGGTPQLLWVGVHQPGGPCSEAALYVSPITSDMLSVRVEAGEQLVVQFEVAEKLRAPVALTHGHTFCQSGRPQPQQQQQMGGVQPAQQQEQEQAGGMQPPHTTTPGWYSYLVQVYGCWDAQEEGTLFPNMLRHCSDGRMAHNMRHAEDLAAFLAAPQRERVEAHAVNLIRAAFDYRRQPEWVLQRLATMWGAEALARFGMDRAWVVARGVQELMAQQQPPARLQL